MLTVDELRNIIGYYMVLAFGHIFFRGLVGAYNDMKSLINIVFIEIWSYISFKQFSTTETKNLDKLFNSTSYFLRNQLGCFDSSPLSPFMLSYVYKLKHGKTFLNHTVFSSFNVFITYYTEPHFLALQSFQTGFLLPKKNNYRQQTATMISK